MILGIDIGGTRIKTVGYEKDGSIVFNKRVLRDKNKELYKEILEIIKDSGSVDYIGIAVAGWVTTNGYIKYAPNLFLRDYPLGDYLREHINVPIFFDNDVNATLMADYYFGVGKGYNSIIEIFFGTGVGTAAMEKGKLIRGKENFAMEGGHIILNPQGPKCRCGKFGCFEAYCGGDYLNQRWQGFLKSKGINIEKEIYSLKDIKDHKFGIGFYEEYIESMCHGISIMIELFSPQLVIIGGGVIEGVDGIEKIVKRRIQKYLIEINRDIEIKLSSMSDKGGCMGVVPLEDVK